MSREDAGAALIQLRVRVDRHFDGATERSPAAFQCREGCDTCCQQRFGVFEIEAGRIREALRRLEHSDPALRERVRAQAATVGHCALLVDGRCTVYEERPIICRSHGLPVATRTDPAVPPRVDCCPLNFTAHEIPAASVLDLDAINQPLSVMARIWEPEPGRVQLADLAGAD